MHRNTMLSTLNMVQDKMNEDEVRILEELILKISQRITEENLAKSKTITTDWTPASENIDEVVIAYTDGSHDKNRCVSGSGIVFLKDENTVIKTDSFATDDKHNMWNICGECEASIRAIKTAIDDGYKEIHIYYDYEGVEKWATRNWKAKNVYTKGYVDRFDNLNKKIKVKFFKVKGHSKDKWNDEADRLAKASLGK
ncbi:MAG: RNase H family protein [Romboutsia sp.]